MLIMVVATLTSCTGLEVTAEPMAATAVYVGNVQYYRVWHQDRYIYYPYAYGPYWRPSWHYHITPTPPPHHKPETHRPTHHRPPVQPSHKPDGTPQHRPGTGHPGYSNPRPTNPPRNGGNVRPGTRSFNGNSSRGGTRQGNGRH